MTIARRGRFSDYVVLPWLDGLAGGYLWVAAFASDPFAVSNPSTVEISSPTYARQRSTFHRSGRILVSDNDISFTGWVAGTTLDSIGVFDAATSGHLLFGGPVPGALVSYPNGGGLTLTAGTIRGGLDA